MSDSDTTTQKNKKTSYKQKKFEKWHFRGKNWHNLVPKPQIGNGCQIRTQDVEKHAKIMLSEKKFENLAKNAITASVKIGARFFILNVCRQLK